MARKTEDHKEFEAYIKEYENVLVVTFALNKAGRYKDRFLQFGFGCWMESKRIQKLQAQG